jgi:hypothetical protein
MQGATFLVVLPSILYYCFIFVPLTRIPILFYFGWMFYDRKYPKVRFNNTIINICRLNPIYQNMQHYFSAKLVKTCEIDPTKRYILTGHPHGAYSFNMNANIVFNRNFAKTFPGLLAFVATLQANFYIPIWGDYLLLNGVFPAGKAAIMDTLINGPPGTCVILLVGGVEEALYMKKGIYKFMQEQWIL